MHDQIILNWASVYICSFVLYVYVTVKLRFLVKTRYKVQRRLVNPSFN